MRFLKWMFCTFAISAGAFFAIGSSSPILSDNYEALTSGDPNDTPKEIPCVLYMNESDAHGTVRIIESGNCATAYHTHSAENNPTCIPVEPYPIFDPWP